MTLEQARATLLNGAAGMGDLLLAIGTIVSDRTSSLADLILGLSHPELIAEQASLSLYRRTGRPLPADRFQISTAPEEWLLWLLENRNGDANERLRVLLAASAATATRVNPKVASKLADAIDQAAR